MYGPMCKTAVMVSFISPLGATTDSLIFQSNTNLGVASEIDIINILQSVEFE